jgi:GTP-binding protein HflX
MERTVLVAAGEERHVDELGRLSATLGLEVCGVLEQVRRDGSGYLGGGKRAELARLVREVGAELVVTDDELTASQARTLERDAGVPVMDRTELIIKIFYDHAQDAASKLQVELAELEYLLPRARGMWTHLERQEGGGGSSSRGATRGPGEQQLEYDRRMIRERIQAVRKKLENEKSSRSVRSARLRESGPPIVTLVGYTNAGKTTILNALSGTRRSVRDRLFETLETTTRIVEGGQHNGGSSSRPDFVLTDTVGFIRKLPTQLVESFAGTLESAREADIIVLCADASSKELEEEIQTVFRTLKESEINTEKTILCLNKVDRLEARGKKTERERHNAAVQISALEDTRPLLERIYEEIASIRERVQVLIPHAEYGAAADLYGKAEIHDSKDTFQGVLMDVTAPSEIVNKYQKYAVSQNPRENSSNFR